MSGKHKQAQRIKNNARPSSSGRSAELLAKFSGFPTLNETGFVLPGLSLAKTDEIDPSIDTNFQLVFKKMSKKDSTTKLKALQEFADLVEKSEAEAVRAVLAFWARLYTILATDVEHKVREAAHNAHYQVVLKDKKSLAPFLKQLIGPWFTAQYDTYPPAASAASKAFQTAFPSNKVQNVVIFCQEQLVGYISDNLLQTQQSSNSKSPTEEDAKYERIIITSLQGYALYLNNISVAELRKVEELNRRIVESAKFWKFAKYKISIIRAVWFNVLSILCQKFQFLLENEYVDVVSVIFSNLDDNDPTVLPQIWEAALLMMELIKDWWTLVNVEKVLFPKVWKVLREGGQGNAVVIYPNLLPLISKLPQSIDKGQFYNSFFENLRLGLRQKSVMASRSESVAVATSFFECLQFIIYKNESDEICGNLIKSQLLPLIKWCFNENQSIYKTIFNLTASLIQNWSRNRKQNNYSKYLQLFWEKINELFREMLNLNSHEMTDLPNKQIEFLVSLKHTFKVKKQLKVQFSGDVECKSPESLEKTVLDHFYFEELNNLAYNLSEIYIDLIEEKRNKILVQHLLSLIQDFDSHLFLLKINEKFRKQSQTDSMVNVYHNLFEKWLKCNYLSSKPIVDLIFLVFAFLSDAEKEQTLISFKQFSFPELGWCIEKAFSHPHSEQKAVKLWLKSETVGNFLAEIVQSEIDNSPSEFKPLIKLAFTENMFGEILIAENAITEIIEKLMGPLKSPENYPNIDSCSNLLCYISTVIYSDNFAHISGDDLLLAMFEMSCKNYDLEHLTDDTKWEINTSWQDAIAAVTKSQNPENIQKLIVKLSDIFIAEFLCDPIENFNLDQSTEIVVNLFQSIFKGQPIIVNDCLNLFFKRDFVDLWQNQISSICKQWEFLRGHLCSPYEKLKFEQLEEINVFKYFLWKYLQIFLLSSNLDEDCIAIQTIDDNIVVLAHFLYDLAIGVSFVDNNKTCKYLAKINNFCNLMQGKIQFLFGQVNETNLRHFLVKQASQEAWFWCWTLHILHEQLGPVKLEIFDDFKSNLSLLHMIRVFHSDFDLSAIERDFSAIENAFFWRNLLNCEGIERKIEEFHREMVVFRAGNKQNYLLESLTILDSCEIMEIIHLFSDLAKYKFDCFNRNFWDLSVLSLVSWTANCCKVKTHYENLQVQSIFIAVVELFVNLNNAILKLKETKPNHSFISEWEDIFVADMQIDVIKISLFLAEQFGQKSNTDLVYLPLLETFANVINSINYKYIFNNDGSLPKWSKILKTCCNLIINPKIILQLWSYNILNILVPGLIEIETLAVETSKPHGKGLIFEQFKSILMQTHEIVSDFLMGFKLGEDSCQVKPFTDSFTYIFAYLLLWDVLLDLWEKSSTELRFQYAEWLRNEDLLKNLLEIVFRLMPMEVLHCKEVKLNQKLFVEKPKSNIDDLCTSEELEHMACWIYYKCVSQLRVLVRQWWSNTEPKIGQFVEKITSLYVSPHLCNQELQDVANHEKKFKNMVVKTVPNVRQVLAIYTVDDCQMELVISLPQNYPLTEPDVECSRQIGRTSHKQWLMQLKKCFLHQNGQIWDGLSLWNKNLDKKFDGVEECYICFAVLHPGTYQLPKLSCQTCKKKFHSACLYKWFSTSNKSTCPICRNLF